MTETTAQRPPDIYAQMGRRDRVLRHLFDGLVKLLGPTILCDIGAFNGDESFRFASMLPGTNIHAFEASPRNFRQFFVEDLRFAPLRNVTAVHMAVAERSGMIAFHELHAGEEGSDWRRAASSLRSRVEPLDATPIAVPCTTLDDYFGAAAIAGNTFALWIDAEGALDRVLAGAKEVLQKTLLIKAEMEWKEIWAGQALAPELKTRIEAAGFLTVGDSHLDGAYDQSDAVFVNRYLVDLLVARDAFGKTA